LRYCLLCVEPIVTVDSLTPEGNPIFQPHLLVALAVTGDNSAPYSLDHGDPITGGSSNYNEDGIHVRQLRMDYNFRYNQLKRPTSIDVRIYSVYVYEKRKLQYGSHISHGAIACSISDFQRQPYRSINSYGLARSMFTFKAHAADFISAQPETKTLGNLMPETARMRTRFKGTKPETLTVTVETLCLNNACRDWAGVNRGSPVAPILSAEETRQLNSTLHRHRHDHHQCKDRLDQAEKRAEQFSALYDLCTESSFNLLRNEYYKYNDDTCQAAPRPGLASASPPVAEREQYAGGITTLAALTTVRAHQDHPARTGFMACLVQQVGSENAAECKYCVKGVVDCLSECSLNPFKLALCSFCTLRKTIVLGPKCWSCGKVAISFFRMCLLRRNQRKALRRLR
jgi:hypothetical protein